MSLLRNRRLSALVRKEFAQIVRDPSSYLVAGVLPALFLLLFGFGITLDPGTLRLGILDESRSRASLALTADFEASSSFSVLPLADIGEAERVMRESGVQGFLRIREDFARSSPLGSPACLQLIVDGTEPNSARFLQGYGLSVLQRHFSAGPDGGAQPRAMNLETRFWYNPEAKSVNFLVPGAVTVIMTLIGTLLTSLVFAREWERGTMEAMLATPVTPMQLLLGKLIPYFCLGMFSMLLCTLLAVFLFDVPFRGSVAALLLVSSVFLLSALGQGLFISVHLRAQLVAAEAGLFTGFLPALLLSGFIFDIDSMPLPLRILSQILPATHCNHCLRCLFLAGTVPEVLIPHLLALAGLAALLLTVVYRRIRKSID